MVFLLTVSSQNNNEVVYRAFVRNVVEFRACNSLPAEIVFEQAEKEDIVVQNLMVMRASWHKSCHLKFSTSKLDRVKRKIDDQVGKCTNSRIETLQPF